MKRKVVQHGPSTLTISLPSSWVKERGIQKGDELNVEPFRQGLFVSSQHGIRMKQKRIRVAGLTHILTKVVAACYKAGYDEIVLEYDSTEQLEAIFGVLGRGCIGMEVVSEQNNQVAIRSVSEPSQEEFKALFRRVFYFLLTMAEEGCEAATAHDKDRYKKIMLRDEVTVDKLTNFCRRIVNKKGESGYQSETALYHIIEQLEKIGDRYKAVNEYLSSQDRPADEAALARYSETNALLRAYEELFFSFSLEKLDAFVGEYRSFRASSEKRQTRIHFLLESIATELYDLIGTTMLLHL